MNTKLGKSYANVEILQQNDVANYVFFDGSSNELNELLTIKQLSVFDSPDVAQNGVFSRLSKLVRGFLKTENSNLQFCVFSPVWLPDNRITRHRKLMNKAWDIEAWNSIEFIDQKEITHRNKMIYCGIGNVNESNFGNIMSSISTYNCGFLIAVKNDRSHNLAFDFFSEAAKHINYEFGSDKLKLRYSDFINRFSESGASVLLPYDWSETGTFHLDIFELN